MQKCFHCQNEIKDLYRLSFQEYCSIGCYEERYKKAQEEVKASPKVEDRSQTNKRVSRRNKVSKKVSKQKTRKNKR